VEKFQYNQESGTELNMSYQLDHLFIYTSVGAPEAAHLTTFGLTEGFPNSHPGKGTANRRFFFYNVMLELFWVRDESEAKSELTRPAQLWERWAGRSGTSCPFGACFRPASRDISDPPFRCWKYRPTYLPEPLCIDIAMNVAVLAEPMLFYLAFGRRPDMHPAVKPEQLRHAAGLREVTRVEMSSPHADNISLELKAVANAGLLRVRPGNEYLMEISFDEELQMHKRDFRPALPLIFSW
jgi:hypothetical protein